jgi:histidinol dehydrogenase
MSVVPRPLEWARLDAPARRDALRRPVDTQSGELRGQVETIVRDVGARGDEALREYTLRYDGVALTDFAVSDSEFAAAGGALSPPEAEAIARAIATVTRFHEAQLGAPVSIETAPGVRCERVDVPIGSVGLYVPAGSAPLPSTAIMLAVPARLAGCPRRVLCTPPRRDGSADPAVLFAALACGITTVYKLGGAQAIAALAYGTPSVPRVDKIFGPGNAWVAAAKQLVAADVTGPAIDLPAGPSEVLVISDGSSPAEFVAADLLAQAEHGVDAQVVLVTDSRRHALETIEALERQLADLPRREIAGRALGGARIILASSLDSAFEVSNEYAPEHLILHLPAARHWLPLVRNAGSVFLGGYTPESLGDYCSGTNHVLPTGGHARACSGLGVADFVKRITIQEATAEGLRTLGPVAIALARLEGLEAHARAVDVRLAALDARAAS